MTKSSVVGAAAAGAPSGRGCAGDRLWRRHRAGAPISAIASTGERRRARLLKVPARARRCNRASTGIPPRRAPRPRRTATIPVHRRSGGGDDSRRAATPGSARWTPSSPQSSASRSRASRPLSSASGRPAAMTGSAFLRHGARRGDPRRGPGSRGGGPAAPDRPEAVAAEESAPRPSTQAIPLGERSAELLDLRAGGGGHAGGG